MRAGRDKAQLIANGGLDFRVGVVLYYFGSPAGEIFMQIRQGAKAGRFQRRGAEDAEKKHVNIS
jgi:hypothetical protein